VTSTSWNFVGDGNGSFAQREKYRYVGDGSGSFIKKTQTTYSSWRPRPCCVAFGVVLALSGLVFGVVRPGLAWAAPPEPSPERSMMPTADPLPTALAAVSQPKQVTLATTTRISSQARVAAAPSPPRARYNCSLNSGNTTDDSAMNQWSELKQLWCCSRMGLGCTTSTTTSTTNHSQRYDCHEGLHWEQEWSYRRKSWCCLHLGRGCPSTRLTTSRSVYDCSAGFSSWANQWSLVKRDWCCVHFDRGCPITTSHPYDCDAGVAKWQQDWSLGKMDWCCRHYGRACPTTPEADVSFDCHAGFATSEKGWTREKKNWCCEKYASGCSQIMAAAVGGEVGEDRLSTEKAAVVTPASPKCDAGYAKWKSGWDGPPMSQEAWCCQEYGKAWCCKHYGRECPAPTPLPALPYDCHAGYTIEWPSNKTSWCCRHYGLGCLTTTTLEFDCAAGFSNWEHEWSLRKRRFCCESAGRGCPSRPTAFAHDCETGFVNWAKAWSGSKRLWCCKHYGRGCLSADSAGPPSEAPRPLSPGALAQRSLVKPSPMPRAATSSPLHDCEAGFANWAKVWSTSKKRWCCVYHGRGCLETAMERTSSLGFDCEAGYVNWEKDWSVFKKDWCCEHQFRGCDQTTSRLYDCQAGLGDFRLAWSPGKQKWCCIHQRLGCRARQVDGQGSDRREG